MYLFMLRTMKYLIIIYLLSSSIYAQTWDSNYYDTNILYDNTDLLQLTEYQKLKLKNRQNEINNIKELENLSNNTTNEPTVEVLTIKNVQRKKNIISFSDMSQKVNNLSIEESVITQNIKKYFIDF